MDSPLDPRIIAIHHGLAIPEEMCVSTLCDDGNTFSQTVPFACHVIR